MVMEHEHEHEKEKEKEKETANERPRHVWNEGRDAGTGTHHPRRSCALAGCTTHQPSPTSWVMRRGRGILPNGTILLTDPFPPHLCHCSARIVCMWRCSTPKSTLK
jgi:hypothetical protein